MYSLCVINSKHLFSFHASFTKLLFSSIDVFTVSLTLNICPRFMLFLLRCSSVFSGKESVKSKAKPAKPAKSGETKRSSSPTEAKPDAAEPEAANKGMEETVQLCNNPMMMMIFIDSVS